MKKRMFMSIFAVLTMMLNAQTYVISSSGNGVCNDGDGLGSTYSCDLVGDEEAALVGPFIDTNEAGFNVESLVVKAFFACDGVSELFLNGVSIGNVVVTGTRCNCSKISDVPGITNTLNVTLTPEIKAAYLVGQENTITLKSLDSIYDSQCFFGAEVRVSSTVLNVKDLDMKEVSFFPNPTINKLSVKGLKNKENYIIYDVRGAVVSKGEISVNGFIDVENYPNGTYILRFDNAKTFKFIKN